MAVPLVLIAQEIIPIVTASGYIIAAQAENLGRAAYAAGSAIAGGIESLYNWFTNADETAAEMAGEETEEEEDVKEKSITDVCSDCEPPDGEEQEANVHQKIKGKTRHGEKSGGINQANKDFDSLKPSDVKNIDSPKGDIRTGKLNNGQNVTVRNFSSDGRPTLEIRTPDGQIGGGRGIEMRYNP